MDPNDDNPLAVPTMVALRLRIKRFSKDSCKYLEHLFQGRLAKFAVATIIMSIVSRPRSSGQKLTQANAERIFRARSAFVSFDACSEDGFKSAILNFW